MEDYVAVFDIGTTAIKGSLINKNANMVGNHSILLETIHGANGEVEQDPMHWWNAIKVITAKWWSENKIEPKQIITITFSGQMEDVIPIATNEQSYNTSAILYSDTRANIEADFINKILPNIEKKIGNSISASTPLAKLLWIKKHNPSLYNETSCFVFSAKDFIIHKLTESFATDPTTAATTGMMDLTNRHWIPEILESFHIHATKLPAIYNAEEIVGYITKKAAKELGYVESTPVLCGSGDAGASTMGAGAVNPRDAYFYIGTTGWVATIHENINLNKKIDGIFNLAHLPKGSTITVTPLLNAGNVHQWAVETYVANETEHKYEAFEKLIEKSRPGSMGLLFLPYLNGERSPIHDTKAKGAYWGIGPGVEKHDMARAVIEGICYSLKQLTELLIDDKNIGRLTLIGGGSKSNILCQTLADMIGKTILVPEDSEYIPSLGAAASGFVQVGWADTYKDFAGKFLITTKTKSYEPIKENNKYFDETFNHFVKLYPNLKNMYS